MALSVDWGTRVITVPKADLALVDIGPPEVRELDLDAFRLELKSLEDDEQGIVYPDTHEHVTQKTLGAETYARMIVMVNGFTVTFENGSYMVDLRGANSNVSDVTNLNQVSVRSYNSAGLIVTGGADPADVADAVHDEVVEGGITLRQAVQILLAVCVGKSSGGDTSRIKFRDMQDLKDRVDEEVDDAGNRLDVTLDVD